MTLEQEVAAWLFKDLSETVVLTASFVEAHFIHLQSNALHCKGKAWRSEHRVQQRVWGRDTGKGPYPLGSLPHWARVALWGDFVILTSLPTCPNSCIVLWVSLTEAVEIYWQEAR